MRKNRTKNTCCKAWFFFCFSTNKISQGDKKCFSKYIVNSNISEGDIKCFRKSMGSNGWTGGQQTVLTGFLRPRFRIKTKKVITNILLITTKIQLHIIHEKH